MADDTQADATQADADATSQADTDATSTTTTGAQDASAQAATASTDGKAEETISLEEARKLRREAAGLRKRLKEIEDAQLSEAEKLKRDLAETERERDQYRERVRELAAKDAVMTAASAALKPETVWRIVRADIEYDDVGAPVNAKALVDAVKKDAPELFRSANGSADGGAGAADKTARGGMNQLIREAAGRA